MDWYILILSAMKRWILRQGYPESLNLYIKICRQTELNLRNNFIYSYHVGYPGKFNQSVETHPRYKEYLHLLEEEKKLKIKPGLTLIRKGK